MQTYLSTFNGWRVALRWDTFFAKISLNLVCLAQPRSHTTFLIFLLEYRKKLAWAIYLIREVRIRPRFTYFYSKPPVDEWFHAAAVWKRDSEEVFLFIDGQKVGTESNVPSNSTFKDDLPPTFDIGRKNGRHSLIGHLRDLMIIRRPLTGEELTNMEGEKLLTF